MKVTKMLSQADARAKNRDFPESFFNRELRHVISVVAWRDGELSEVLTVKTFHSRARDASVWYAGIWIHARGRVETIGTDADGDPIQKCTRESYHTHGYGSAGGGYDKKSSAIAAAIHAAGIHLDGRADAGDSCWREALEAIARHLGFRKIMLTEN